MTTFKKNQQHMQDESDTLRLEIQRLQQVLVEAKKASDAKSAFLANVTHELRTPLNSILGFAQILNQHTSLSNEQSEYLDLILTSGKHLLDLIEDILQITKIESGQVELNPIEFDLQQLLTELESVYRAEAEEKGLKFETNFSEDIPPYIYADRNKVRQICSNLLSNALKFTDKGSITFSIYPEKPEDLSIDLHIAVADTGMGIKRDELGKLFQPYHQTSSGLQSNKGSGLGLTITKEFVRLMNGQIKVKSEWEKGTTFLVKIQVQIPQKPTIETPDASPEIISIATDNTQYRILVVDDQKNNRLLLEQTLKQIGFEVLVAENGMQAIDSWQTWSPQLILMDMKMAKMDGYTATHRIKELDKKNNTRIIAVTASAVEYEQDAVILAACDDYVSKPIHLPVLFEKIQKHLDVQFNYDNTLLSTRTQFNIDDLRPDLRERLRKAATNYSLEQIQTVVSDFPQDISGLADFILAKATEFDFTAIIRFCDMSQVK